MRGNLASAVKAHATAAIIVIGAVVVAIPVFVFLLIGHVVEIAASWIMPRAPMAVDKFRQLAELAEVRISGQKNEWPADLPASTGDEHGGTPKLTAFLRRALSSIPSR